MEISSTMHESCFEPICKKNKVDISDAGNYRPVSPTTNMSKVFDIILLIGVGAGNSLGVQRIFFPNLSEKVFREKLSPYKFSVACTFSSPLPCHHRHEKRKFGT